MKVLVIIFIIIAALFALGMTGYVIAEVIMEKRSQVTSASGQEQASGETEDDADSDNGDI